MESNNVQQTFQLQEEEILQAIGFEDHESAFISRFMEFEKDRGKKQTVHEEMWRNMGSEPSLGFPDANWLSL